MRRWLVALLLVGGACASDSSSPATEPSAPAATAASTIPVSTLAASTTTTPPTTTTTAPASTTTSTAATAATAAPTTASTTTIAPATDPPSDALASRPTIDDLLALERPIVLAHAGGEDAHPHSTPYAFAESVAAGVDVLDMDVQLSGDGVLIVHHDADVDRTTNGTGNVAEMTYQELFALDNAYDFIPRDGSEPSLRGVRTGDTPAPAGYTPDDFVIPRFRDIVERFPAMPLNIEVKGSGDPALAAARVLAQELDELGVEASAVVTSFDDAAMAEFLAAGEVEVTPGLGAASAWVLDGTPLPGGMRILQLPMEFEGIEVITPELIERSHAAGYVIWVWPNDSAWESFDAYGELIAMGLDGLNINLPAEGVAAVALAT